MKNTLEMNNSRLEDAEQIRQSEDYLEEQWEPPNQNTEKKKKNPKQSDSLRDLWIKSTDICIVGVPEEDRREKGTEILLK